MKLKQGTLAVLLVTTIPLSATHAAKPEYSDVNGDGVISADEIISVRQQHRATMLAQYDADNDGELSRSERKVMRNDRHDALLLQFDSDGDGELSREEHRAAKDARRAAIRTMLDVNGDGVLSDLEKAGMEEVKALRNESHGHDGKRRKKRL